MILITIGLAFSAYNGYHLSKLVKEQKQYKEYIAEINMVNYGLFNMELWKEKALDIFSTRIDDFTISPQVYDDVELELRKYLKKMYKEYIASGKLVNQFVDQAHKSGKLNKLFATLIKKNVGSMLGDMDIEAQIPQFAATLSAELKKNEPMLKGYLAEGLKNLIFEGNGEKVSDPRMNIYQHFGQSDLSSTNIYLTEKISSLEISINKKVKFVYLSILGLAIISLLFYSVLGGVVSISLVTLASIILLILGVTMPMIDIDARLNAFKMAIVGNEVSFNEQYLYYQSKSILDVTKTLIAGKGIDLKLVGIMILLFSVIVPFIKLVLSTLFLNMKSLRNSKITKAIIYHLGKWSMADVFVVAMFMAYIGFYGLISAQLGNIGRNETGYAVETINYSKLSPGALFFTTYCILSIVTGILIKRWELKQDLIESV